MIAGFNYDAERTGELMSEFDVDFSGFIELPEFIVLFKQRLR